MKLGSLEYFCSCLLPNMKEHLTAPDSQGNCVYCGYHVIQRKVTEADLRAAKFWAETLSEKKREHLELRIKDLRHETKVN
jgi:hypothetical protein